MVYALLFVAFAAVAAWLYGNHMELARKLHLRWPALRPFIRRVES